MSVANSNPVILVTGASKGIGLATTKALLTELEPEAASVATISRTLSDELKELKEQFTGRLITFELDLKDETKVREAIRTTYSHFGRLDGLVLNAGVVEPLARIEDATVSTTEAWKAHFDLNFFSLLYTVQEALPLLKAGEATARIILISSGAATGSIGGMGAYNASKAALNSFGRTLGSEERSIVTIALRPGMVDTPMQTLIRETGGEKGIIASDAEKFKGAHRDGKLIRPNESGYCIAALSLRATIDLSGQFVSWDGQECAPYRRP